MRVERDIWLPSTPEEAWSVLIDWERQPDWMKDADRVDVLTPYREGPGVRIAVRTRVLNVPAFTERLEVLVWEPPRRLLMAHRSFIHGTGEWLLDPAHSGTTFSWIEEISLPIPVLGELALRLYRPVMRFLMRSALEGLRRSVSTPRPRL